MNSTATWPTASVSHGSSGSIKSAPHKSSFTSKFQYKKHKFEEWKTGGGPSPRRALINRYGMVHGLEHKKQGILPPRMNPKQTLKIETASAPSLNVLPVKSSVDEDSFNFDDSDEDSLSASVTSGSPHKSSPEEMQLSTPVGDDAMFYSQSSEEDSDDEIKDPTFQNDDTA